MNIPWCNAHLMVPLCQVQLAEDSSSLQAVQQVINAWQREPIFYGLVIQRSVVHTEPELAIWLAHKQYRCSKWGL